MEGQWVGEAQGSNSGDVILNIDRIGERYLGYLVLWDSDPGLASIIADVELNTLGSEVQLHAINVRGLDPATGLMLRPEQQSRLYPLNTLASEINFHGTMDSSNKLVGTYKTDTDREGSVSLVRASGTCELTHVENITWIDFKARLARHVNDGFVYRGMPNNTWGLRTSFHRTGRSDLLRYFRDDVPRLYRHVHALTGLRFDLGRNDDVGALLYLAQHHGFPTPLLDWSYSPYVAAYFAFQAEVQPGCDHVRIYVFDRLRWCSDTFQSPWFQTQGLTITYHELLASGNKRAMPQQAVTTLSNLDFMEYMFAHAARGEDKPYLSAYDIPISERSHVLADLRLMGITAGSLFPDLDGVCRELKDQFFT